jgi:ABC-type transport system substrate-binding protein
VQTIKTSDLAFLNDFRSESDFDYSQQMIAFFNTRSGPTADKAFRQGLLYALPEMSEFGMPCYGPIAPSSWGYNPQLKKYKTNPELAKKLVSKEIASGSAKIKLGTVSNYRPVAERLKKAWEEIGLEVSLETADYSPQNHHVFVTSVKIGEDPDQYQQWHSTSSLNISGYKSPKSDKLLEEGRQAMDEKTRKQIYADWQKAITEDAPAAFLYFPYIHTVSRN